MTSISFEKCFHHSGREAVVRCPVCRRYYCRECVTEHDDRMLCTGCLNARLQHVGKKKAGWRNAVVLFFQGSVGFLLLWICFFLVGKMLLTIPHSFHEGAVWKSIRWLQ